MTLSLDIALAPSSRSTFGSIVVVCLLENLGHTRLLLPGPEDRGGALTFTLRDGDGRSVLRMNGLSSQATMSGARVDSRPTLAPLGPGERWSWTIDLASYQYAPPPGRLTLEAVYEHGALRASAGPIPVEIEGPALHRILDRRDNCVLEGLTLLFETAEGAVFLRQHGAGRPIAAWLSKELDGPGPGAFLSVPSFFQTASFEPFFQRWVLWTSQGAICARRFDQGEPATPVLRAPLPAGEALLSSAIHTETGEVLVFSQIPGQLRAYYLTPGALAPAFARSLPPRAGKVEVSADDEKTHLLVPHRGLLHLELSHDGRPLGQKQLFSTRLLPVSLSFDPPNQRIKAIFRDGPLGRLVQLGTADLRTGKALLREGTIPLRGRIEELAFDVSPKGTIHLLCSTSEEKLYYIRDDQGPALIASGEARFFPEVAAPGLVYLGLYRRAVGYRFLLYSHRRQGGKIIDLTQGPWS